VARGICRASPADPWQIVRPFELADLLENVSAAIIVDQQRLGGNSRSTVATVTDMAQMLLVLYSRLAEPRLPSPGFYSYNDPRGMCAECEGISRLHRATA
jgi:excinuclease UvrABC ATPase subunit